MNEKIINIRPLSGEVIETSTHTYERYGPDAWFIHYGESTEPYYYCEDMEKLYQEWKRQNAK